VDLWDRLPSWNHGNSVVVHPQRSHMGFPMDGPWWLRDHIIPLGVKCMSYGCQAMVYNVKLVPPTCPINIL